MFSQLVADNQFAVLGLVLLGCLGRACDVTGVIEMMMEEEAEDVVVALKDLAKRKEVGDLIGGMEGDVGVVITRDCGDEDLGEALERLDDDVPPEDNDNGTAVEGESIPVLLKAKLKKRKTLEPPSTSVLKTPPKKAKKKKSKKKDAIDDLFSGLI